MCARMARFSRGLVVGCLAAAVTAAGAQPSSDTPPDSAALQAAARTSGSAGPVDQAPIPSAPASGQYPGAPEAGPKQQALREIARRLLGIDIKPGGNQPKSLEMLILPVFDQNPTNGLITGIEVTGTYQPKDATTQKSTFYGGIAYSSKSQLLTGVEYRFYPAGNRWNLQRVGRLVHRRRGSVLGGTGPPETARRCRLRCALR
jgi:hypothetical protein